MASFDLKSAMREIISLFFTAAKVLILIRLMQNGTVCAQSSGDCVVGN